MHTNLFTGGHSRADVKLGLYLDHKRNSGIIKVLDIIFMVCVLYLVRDFPRSDATAIIIAVVAGIIGMRCFVDQSMRNFYLHRLDWEDVGTDDARG